MYGIRFHAATPRDRRQSAVSGSTPRPGPLGRHARQRCQQRVQIRVVEAWSAASATLQDGVGQRRLALLQLGNPLLDAAGGNQAVIPVSSAEYPTPARRPAWSVLDNVKLQHDFGIALPAWQEGLSSVMAQIPIT